MRSAIVSLILFALILAGGIGISSMISSKKEEAPRLPSIENVTQVSYRIVQNSSIPAVVEVNGRLVARDRVELFSEVNGTYRSGGKLFKEGTYFKQGEVLFNMADQEFLMTLRAQRSSFMNQITLMLPDMKSDYPASFPTWSAYLDSIRPDQRLPELPQPASDQERYYLTAKNIMNLYYSIRSQEARLAKYQIYAPFSGKVSVASITEGTLVRAGQKLGEFFNPNSYEMEASVSLRELPYLQQGNTVELRSEDMPGKWTGRVLRVSDVIDAQTQTVRVFIGVNGESLKEGMYLLGTANGKALPEVVAIDRGLLNDDNSVFVAIPGQEVDSTAGGNFLRTGTLKKVTVEPLQFADDRVMIKGLANGSWLVEQVIPGAYEGMTVSLFQLD